MVELVTYYSNRPDLLSDLRRTCAAVFEPDDYLTAPDPPASPGGRDWRLRDRLSDDDIQTLVSDFKAGTPKRRLAQQYGISESSVKNLLRQHGVRRAAHLTGRLAVTATVSPVAPSKG